MKLLLTITLFVCVAVALAQRPGGRYSSRFSSFQSRFGKKYGSRAEEIQRLFFYPKFEVEQGKFIFNFFNSIKKIRKVFGKSSWYR